MPDVPASPARLPDSDTDRRHSLAEFVAATDQRDLGEGFFELERDRLLEVNLGLAGGPNGGGAGGGGGTEVWIKAGAMVAYTGKIGFEREGMLEHGLGKFLKKAVSGEGAKLTKATGRGRLYLADQGKKVTVLYLDGDSLYVNGNDLLAFEPSLEWDINLMRSLGAIAGGGLFNVRFAGRGMLAITTHYDPLTLRLDPGGPPVFTDPQATVAWSGNLTPDFKTDVQFKTLLGRGSGESIQMRFDPARTPGFVVVQPFEERPVSATA